MDYLGELFLAYWLPFVSLASPLFAKSSPCVLCPDEDMSSLLLSINKKAVPSCLVKTNQKCRAFPFCQSCTALTSPTE